MDTAYAVEKIPRRTWMILAVSRSARFSIHSRNRYSTSLSQPAGSVSRVVGGDAVVGLSLYAIVSAAT